MDLYSQVGSLETSSSRTIQQHLNILASTGKFVEHKKKFTRFYRLVFARFLNNPERTMSGAAFFGLALISGSKLVFALAVISHLSHWWFLSKVEKYVHLFALSV